MSETPTKPVHEYHVQSDGKTYRITADNPRFEHGYQQFFLCGEQVASFMGHVRWVRLPEDSPTTEPATPEKPKLVKCATCGSKANRTCSLMRCTNEGCNVDGPRNDPDGTKWNAMQRCIREHKLLREYANAIAGDTVSQFANSHGFREQWEREVPGDGLYKSLRRGTRAVLGAVLARLDAMGK